MKNPDYSDELARSRARFEAILRHYVEVNAPKEQKRIIEDCFKQLNIPPGGTVPPDKVNEFAALVATRLTHHLLGVRHEEELSPERTAEILKKTR